MHKLFKKQDLIEFVVQEVALLDRNKLDSAPMVFTHLAVMNHFSASGEEGILASVRKAYGACGEGFDSRFALLVANYRDQQSHDSNTQALIDLMWGLWSDTFDDETEGLTVVDMQKPVATFLWHR